jgi:hypothetical protein
MITPYFVQGNLNGFGASTSFSLAYSSNNTLGNLLIAGLFGTTSPGVTDTAGNTWNQIGTTLNPGGIRTTSLFYAWNCKAGANTVQVTSGSTDFLDLHLLEYSGVMNTADPFDTTNNNNGNSAILSSGSIVTSLNNDLVIDLLNATNNGILSTTDGTTIRLTDGSGSWVTSDRVIGPLNTTVAASATCNTGAWTAIIASFKAQTTPNSPSDVFFVGTT